GGLHRHQVSRGGRPGARPGGTRHLPGGRPGADRAGGATREYGTVTLVGGGALVALGTGATVWYLRRRAKPHRL
ncbi:hypothetical protein PV378_23485, partial [Streptomyces scabiei]|nr:hypothetical protein [Streptomyces scabiei]